MPPFIARILLAAIIAIAVAIHQLGRLVAPSRRHRRNAHRVVMIGTFYNTGWLTAHATPLTRCPEIEEVLVVCDEPLPLTLAGLRYVCPSSSLKRMVGRNVARVLTLLRTAYRFRPTLYIGYHIMPNAPLALILASIFGGLAAYQMTGGPIQVLGGGFRSENPLLAALGGPSSLLESMMFALLRRFDLIVVRGRSALEFVRDRELNRHCAIITGAIDTERFTPAELEARDIDIVYVGRLVNNKGAEHCIRVMAKLINLDLNPRLAMVGGGPLEDELRRLATELGVSQHIEFMRQLQDVVPVLQRSRLFLLLSPSEGMSIAMLEALAVGLPVVVTDVGELADAFAMGDVGALVQEVDPEQIAHRIAEILQNEEEWLSMSRQARETVVTSFSISAVTEQWSRVLAELER